MRKLYYCLVLLLLLGQFNALAQRRQPVEKKLPQKIEWLPVVPNSHFKKQPLTASSPVQRHPVIRQSHPDFIRQPLTLATNFPLQARNGKPATSPVYSIYRPVNNVMARGQATCDTILLTRQSEIDSFPLLYPGCTTVKILKIDGANANPAITSLDSLYSITSILQDLDIRNTELTSLASLNNITTIGSYFTLDNNINLVSIDLTNLTLLKGIVFFNMPALTSMDGLFSSLTDTDLWSVLYINTSLPGLQSMNNITSMINIVVAGCHQITSLAGLENIQSCWGGIQVVSNQSISDISQLSQITDINNGTLEISHNPSLPTLEGIQHIVYIAGVVKLEDNSNLTSLSDFDTALVVDNIANPDEDQLLIRDNPQLGVCGVRFLCNYLSVHTEAVIENNAAGCSSLNDVIASCGGLCPGSEERTWTGINSDDWDDPDNWLPSGVPQSCTKVTIPAVYPSPQVHHNISIGGLIMENGSELSMNYNDLHLIKTFRMESAYIYTANSITAVRVYEPKIVWSSLEGEFKCEDYGGETQIWGNYFFGNVTWSDSVGRSAGASAFFNKIYGDLTWINNSDYGQNYLGNASPDYDFIYGNLTVINNSWGDMSLGLGGDQPVKIHGNLSINSENGPVNIHTITFTDDNTSHLTQAGSMPIVIDNLYMQKYGGGRLFIDQDVRVNSLLNLDGGYVFTEPGKLLTLGDGCVASTGTPGNSFVQGPLKKIGNQSFTFPIADFRNNRYWYAPLTISAPSSSTDEFTASYFHKDPNTDGYDTAAYAPGFGGISVKEYWNLARNNGNSNVTVSLAYDSLRSGPAYLFNDLQVAGWNGSSWDNLSNAAYSGNIVSGTVTAAVPLTQPGPITFSFKPVRKPVITLGEVDSLPCAGTYFKVPFALDTAMITGNNFSVQLSDSLGNFTGYLDILGTKTVTGSDTILAYMPFYLAWGRHYRIRIIGNLPPDTSVNTRIVIPSRVPQQSFTINGSPAACMGQGTYQYYSSLHEPNTVYTWTLSGGGTLNINGDTAIVNWVSPGNHTLTLRASNNCGNGPQASMQVTVKPPAPAATPAVNAIGRWLYASPPDAAQNVNAYHWYRNDTLIASAAGGSYYASDAGSFTVRYSNDCGEGPASNAVSFAAASIPQTIHFIPVSGKIYTDSPFALDATTTSGLPVSLVIISGPGSLSGNIYTITATGTVTIRAMQTGDNVYDTAAPIIQSFIINKAPQTISFPSIPSQSPGSPALALNATASSELPIEYSLVSGNASLSGNQISFTSVGEITIRATQAGDANYDRADTVTQTFCVRVAELNSIAGPQYVCPGQTVTFTINDIPGLTYHWRLSNGASYPSAASTVTTAWATPGSYTMIVSATGPCGAPSADDSLVVNVINAIQPGTVSNMLPADNANGQQLPLTFSWIPGSNALSYDLYVWDSAATQPATPWAGDIPHVSYTIPNGALAYNKTYKWKLVSKNACLQTDGPVQQFRLKPLPDLFVSDVHAPATAFSGQTITIDWTVTNNGPGNSTTNQSWNDAVFLSFDTVPNFNIPPNTTSAAWSQLDFPIRPLLIGTKPNATALDSGEHYTSSINFTLPVNYSQPLYAYVITNYQGGSNAPLQMTVENDTAKAPAPVVVTLSPTPDLRVDTVFTPATTFSGSTINLSYKVKNYGALTPVGSSWTDRFYISQSPFFSLNTATPLKFERFNGSYYPDATDAMAGNSEQLQTDSAYTRNVQVVIPNFISGVYFIYVVTNSGNSVYEGALAGNNVNYSEVQVFLTPTPLLTISSLAVPVTSASVTQPIGINWNIYNKGFNDNREKNKGHYYLADGACQSGAGMVQLKDSIGFGSSYWIDRVYLSTDGTGFDPGNSILVNTVSHGSENSSLNADIAPATLCVAQGSDPALSNINTFNVIRAGVNFPQSANFTVPSRLPQDKYYVYVLTNASKSVYEYPGTPQVKRSEFTITIQRPDAIVSSVNAPATATGDQPVTLNYSITNNGPGSVFASARKDRLYVSTSNVFNASAELVATYTYNEDLPVGNAVTHTVNYTFPASTSGSRYFYIQTNFDSSFAENNYTNNTSIAIPVSVSTAVPADMIVASLKMADTVYSIFPTQITYTVNNNGAGMARGSWTDSLFISCASTFNPATSYFIAARPHSDSVASGASYSDSFTVNLNWGFLYNNCFPAVTNSAAYFFIKTNSNSGLYENNNNNNTYGTGLRVLINPLVDHIVTSVSGPETATVARPYNTSWTVKNIGYNPGSSYYVGWDDAVYFSPDSVFNSNAVRGSFYTQSTRLQTGQTYSQTKPVIPPNIPTGDYYVFAVSNSANGIYAEKNTSNNANLIRNSSGAAKLIHVIQPQLPDLTDTIVAAPPTIAVGQPLTIVHTVSNKGAGDTYPNNWSNELWLSTDFIPGNAGDIKLSAKNHAGVLPAGQSFNDTITALINLNTVAGNYILISRINSTGNVFESNDTNNASSRFITIYSPLPADLVVSNIAKPDTVYLGYTIDPMQWTVSNNAPNSATGISSDGIYLSKNTVLDSTAVLLAIREKNINMAALGNETISYQPLVNNVTEGNYNLLVKTDVLNNIVESNKNNNTGLAASPIYVKVKELGLNIAENNTLAGISRYYKLHIPDSLDGSTILVTLNSNDSLTMRNELYIGAGCIPSPARFDYKFEKPNYGNQQIVMASVNAGVYYIAVRCASPNPVIQDITLKAVKLPFAILNVQSGSGGNTGNVTIRINGSLFTNDMTAALSHGSTSIHASAVYFTNSTVVYATFNLQGQPLGIYDVILEKPDATAAVLPDGFSIVSPNNGGLLTGGGVNTGGGNGNEPGCDPGAAAGLNSQLVVEVVAPPKAFVDWPFVIQINYNNPTNVDIPAQTRVVYADNNVVMAFTKEDLATAANSLYLTLTEAGGPPGIIRAGGSGTIIIYGKAPADTPGHTMLNFNLK